MPQALLSGTDLQRQTLRLYGELQARRHDWGGQLVFACGECVSATGLPAAVSIAGGTTLALDPDSDVVKRVFRQGGLDFVVNTLDEALRVLKNEVRQQRPLGVGLIAEIGPVLAEMGQRGVQPDLLVHIDAPSQSLFQSSPIEAVFAAAETVENLGREHLSLTVSDGLTVPSQILTAWLAERCWLEMELETTTPVELRAIDSALLETLPADDEVRRRWIQRISHYQRPTPRGVRWVWSQASEVEVVF